MIEPAPLQQINRTYVRVGNRTLTYFSGCDYFRMASHPAVSQALQVGVKKFGLNVAASRMTTGNHTIYQKLENRLAEFFAAPSALLVSNGYITNLIVAQALRGNFSHALMDEKAHPSLQDAAQFLDCPILKFKHRDAENFSQVLTRCGPGAKPILLTDGMYAHDGTIAPLAEYLKILPRDGLILVDDAHAAGTLGKTGQGALELCGVSRQRIVQTVTLSKAFGVYGGAILCSARLREKIMGGSHAFVGHTPPPLPLAFAVLKSVEVLSGDKKLRQRLEENVRYVKSALRQKQFPVAATPAPIVPFLPTNARQAQRLKENLLARKIFPPFLRYPGGPENGYFRFVLSSEHSRMQLDALLQALSAISG